MQTLQTARLTTKPPPPPPPGPSQFSALRKAYDTANRPPQVRATGILRQREFKTAPSQPHHLDADPRAVELLSRFFISQGIPFECASEPTFRDFVKYLNPQCVIPLENVMNKFVEKATCTNKSVVNYQKTVGPLSVTIDMYGTSDEKYLAFSIHYFDDLDERKTVVYLRKMMISQIDPENLLIAIRRVVNHYSYSTVKFSNLVSPDEYISSLIASSGVSKRFYISFYHYITKFVNHLLLIEEFSTGVCQLREFVRSIKSNADLYCKFRRMQLSKNAELDVPAIDSEDWDTTATFLTKCLVFHDTFNEFCERFNVTTYISNETFNHLIYLHGLLDQCAKTCRKLSAPDNSISQLVPEIMTLKRFIERQKMGGYRYHKIIQAAFTESFAQIIIPGVIQHQYDVACLMDPRYAYIEEIYSRDKWHTLEQKVIQEFVDTKIGPERNYFYQDIGQMNHEERHRTIVCEFAKYRRILSEERPQDTDNANKWWGDKQTQLEFMSVLAREYIACPAVTIDASHYFSDGGKFRHMCDTYSNQQLENCLTFAGSYQRFRGRGGSENTITPAMMATLQSTANRLQKQTHFGLYAGLDYIASDREVAEIIGHDYPPMPTAANRDVLMFTDLEEKPSTSSAMSSSSSQTIIRQIRPQGRPVQFNGQLINGRHFAKIQPKPAPVSIRQVPLQVRPQPSKGVPSNWRPSYPGQQKPSTSPSEEQKPTDLFEKDVKQEKEDPLLKDVKEEPLDEDELQLAGAQSTHSERPINRPSVPFRIHPRQGGPMPQNINQHNFVQKFVQKQNFVQKFGSRPQGPSGFSEQIPALKLPQEKKPNEPPLFETNQTQREPKLEMLDDFDRDDDFDQLIEQPGVVYREALNDSTAENAFARHRAILEIQKRRACNRRCAVCGHLELHERLKNVTIENEKLLIMLGCIYRGEFTFGQAKVFMARETKTYICRVHFGETLDEIYSMLHLNTPDDILSCSLDLIQNALISVSALKPHITGTQLRKILHDFCERNEHLRDTRDLAHTCFDDYKESTSAGGSNDVDEQEIIPKVYRQPRKQVLEPDQHDGTVKMIEQEDFKLPTVKPSENEDCENPGVCCFCSKRGDRNGMLRVPRGEDRLARWIEKLGPEFEARLHTHQDNLICRNHFPEAAFSSRGRLLKGMIPDAAPEKVEVTYRIQGNSFLKLNEQKSGTDKNASIDLEKIQYDDVQHLASAARHVSYVPQNVWQSNAKKIATPSSSKGSKKRNSNGDSAADDDDYVPHVIEDEVVTDDEIISTAPGPSTSQPKRPRGRPPKRKTLPAEEGAASIDDEDYVPPRAYGKYQKK